ncbi:MAG: FapA family protein [Bacillota bacterium]
MSKPEAIEIEARSLQDGIAKACATLGVSPKEIEVEVLEKRPTSEDADKRFRLRITPRSAKAAAAAEQAAKEAEAADDSRDGSWLILSREDGIYLVVNPPTGSGRPCSLEGVTRGLADAKVRGVDPAAVGGAVQAQSSQPVKVAAPQPEIVVDGKAEVIVSRDKMQAEVVVFPPSGGRKVSFDDALRLLREHGVVAGIDEPALHRAIELESPRLPVIVARGKVPVNGENGRIEYGFAADRVAGRPAEMEDGRVDFYNLSIVENVVTGQVLATRVPATDGEPGQTVTGEPIKAKPGRPVNILGGTNTELVENGAKLVATADGQAALAPNGRLSIFPVYEVKGDVDFSTGNIDFIGSVVVRGSVAHGFTIKAGNDVTIEGHVDSANIEAGRNVVIRGGVQGRGKGRITAGGSVSVKFIESAEVTAGGDIIIGEAVMHSTISARRKVLVSGKKGLIVGGQIKALEEVGAKVIGSTFATSTDIEVGVDPILYQEMVATANALKETEADLSRTQQAIKLLKDMQEKGELPIDKRALLLKLTRNQFQLTGKREELTNRRAEIEKSLEQRQRGRVRALEVIYPGVRVTIGHSTMLVTDPVIRCRLYLAEHGEIAIGAY